MEEYLFGFTLKIRIQKKVMTTNQVDNFVVTVFINLRGLNTDNH